VVLCGKGGVGKKSLTKRETSDAFLDHLPSVVGINFKTKDYLVQGHSVKVQFSNVDGSTD
jgi:GTPase SAR1 family protein